MIGKSAREAGLPGERFSFEVAPDASVSDADISWSGGGQPLTGTGQTFTTVFPTGGTFVVTARRGDASVDFEVTVCPIDEWLSRAMSFYGSSIDFSRVRVGASRLVLGRPGTAWTCNNVIRFKRARRAEDLPHESTLIHELAHVWEHQNGQAQLLKGATEQIGRILGRDPYDFGGPRGVKGASTLTSFTKEGQAQIVTEWWRAERGFRADRKGVPFSTPGYVEDLRRLVVGAGIDTGRAATRPGPINPFDAAIGSIVNRMLGGRSNAGSFRPK
jgi:hypothetical protein